MWLPNLYTLLEVMIIGAGVVVIVVFIIGCIMSKPWWLKMIFSIWWWEFVFAAPRTLRKIRCRMSNHKPGEWWYNPRGLEPDMRCKGCGDDLG